MKDFPKAHFIAGFCATLSGVLSGLLLAVGCMKTVNSLDPGRTVRFVREPQIVSNFGLSCDFSLETDHDAVIHYAAVDRGGAAPTLEQIVSGSESPGGVRSAGQWTVASGVETCSASLDALNTGYDLYLTAAPVSGLTGLYSTVKKISPTTMSGIVYTGQWYAIGVTYGIAGDAGDILYISYNGNNLIRKYTTGGVLLTQWGGPGTNPGQFSSPQYLTVDRFGNVYVMDTLNDRVQKFDSNGNFLMMFGEPGSGDGQFFTSTGLAVDDDGNIYVTEFNDGKIQKFDSNGNYLLKWNVTTPRDIARDAQGNLYVSDGANTVRKFSPSGTLLDQWGSLGSGDGQFNQVYGLAIDGAGNVYTSEMGNDRVQVFSPDGTFIQSLGSLGSGDGQFNNPMDLFVDQMGRVFVADSVNARVQILR